MKFLKATNSQKDLEKQHKLIRNEYIEDESINEIKLLKVSRKVIIKNTGEGSNKNGSNI